ncbi:glycosyltransferase family 2 protein [Paraglaciecola sp.]|uniref:glycosyltransferase family 2 protein n=1 Tax=Paraglaciecola sp. TaxID=1920173 RepID=UPI00273FB8CB|nr:glycosyltransferase [Paraglaciecola sp.]MDP5029225.1 glycosyltransferase [Paraglaciecola sp.]
MKTGNYIVGNLDSKMYGVLDEYSLSQIREIFDKAYYLSKNKDVKAQNVDAFTHFMNYGWIEGRDFLNTNIVFPPLPVELGFKSNRLISIVRAWLTEYFAKQLAIAKNDYQELIIFINENTNLKLYAEENSFKIPSELITDHFIAASVDGSILKHSNVKEYKNVAKDILSKIKSFNHVSRSFDLLPIKEYYKFPSLLNLNSYCELAFKVDSFIVVVGWMTDQKQAKDLKIKDINGNVIAKILAKETHRRDDVKAIYSHIEHSRDAGFVGIFECVSQEDIYSLGECSVEVNTHANTYHMKLENLRDANVEKMYLIDYLTNLWSGFSSPIEYKVTKTFLMVLKRLLGIDQDIDTDIYTYGDTKTNPTSSVIIPLYGRYDFMRYQLSNFSRFGCLKTAEIIYVVDDPRIAKNVIKVAPELYKLFQIPFKLLLLEKNVGYGRANNIAAQHAVSDNLILLNSDVLPMSSDWDTRLVSYLEQTDNVGLIGVRLLFEDGSIQHDGMAQMELDDFPGLKFNDHPKKGWPLSMVNTPKEFARCDMVTAACVAIKKSLFNKLEGFDSDYLLGDFEDSDLCQKALAHGHSNYIARDIELFHLERQSQNLTEPGDWKFRVTLINAHTFNHKWC